MKRLLTALYRWLAWVVAKLLSLIAPDHTRSNMVKALARQLNKHIVKVILAGSPTPIRVGLPFILCLFECERTLPGFVPELKIDEIFNIIAKAGASDKVAGDATQFVIKTSKLLREEMGKQLTAENAAAKMMLSSSFAGIPNEQITDAVMLFTEANPDE